jgi:hypothetical protein
MRLHKASPKLTDKLENQLHTYDSYSDQRRAMRFRNNFVAQFGKLIPFLEHCQVVMLVDILFEKEWFDASSPRESCSPNCHFG